MQSNARQRCAAYNGGQHTSPHTKSPFNSVHSVPLRSGACLLLAPNQRGLADKRANHRWLPVQSPPSTFRTRVRKPPAFRTELNGIERRERIAGAEKCVARICLRRGWVFGYVARVCLQSNARQRCDAYNGVLNTSPHTLSV